MVDFLISKVMKGDNKDRQACEAQVMVRSAMIIMNDGAGWTGKVSGSRFSVMCLYICTFWRSRFKIVKINDTFDKSSDHNLATVNICQELSLPYDSCDEVAIVAGPEDIQGHLLQRLTQLSMACGSVYSTSG